MRQEEVTQNESQIVSQIVSHHEKHEKHEKHEHESHHK